MADETCNGYRVSQISIGSHEIWRGCKRIDSIMENCNRRDVRRAGYVSGKQEGIMDSTSAKALKWKHRLLSSAFTEVVLVPSSRSTRNGPTEVVEGASGDVGRIRGGISGGPDAGRRWWQDAASSRDGGGVERDAREATRHARGSASADPSGTQAEHGHRSSRSQCHITRSLPSPTIFVVRAVVPLVLRGYMHSKCFSKSRALWSVIDESTMIQYVDAGLTCTYSTFYRLVTGFQDCRKLPQSLWEMVTSHVGVYDPNDGREATTADDMFLPPSVTDDFTDSCVDAPMMKMRLHAPALICRRERGWEELRCGCELRRGRGLRRMHWYSAAALSDRQWCL
ncbi:hypothetical protein B0H13DRAFT_2266809 [Mycena leptocephala]|nr:hypothetical protein B0H13DRAFT_2266809 [Mycena leptocephala]